jgi:hypothetical protein
MTLHLNLDHDSHVYFVLTCDHCGLPFICYDDACYDFSSLRAEAVYTGWDAAARPEQPTYCPTCVRTGARRQTKSRPWQLWLTTINTTNGNQSRSVPSLSRRDETRRLLGDTLSGGCQAVIRALRRAW